MIKITNRFMINSQEFVRSRYGPEGWKDVHGRLELNTRLVFDYHVEPKGLVEFSKVDDVLKAIDQAFSSKTPNVLFDLGFNNSEKDLSATQKFLMKILSVEWVLRIAAILWKQRVVDGGTITIKRLGRGQVRARVSDFSTPTREWWNYLTGWFTCAITFSGGQNVRVKWTGGGESPDDPADFDARWD